MSDAAITDGRTLLLVDDDVTFRTRLARALHDRSLEVTATGSYDEALSAAQQEIATAVESVKIGAATCLTKLTKPVDADQVLAAFNGDAAASAGRVTQPVQSLALVEWDTFSVCRPTAAGIFRRRLGCWPSIAARCSVSCPKIRFPKDADTR